MRSMSSRTMSIMLIVGDSSTHWPILVTFSVYTVSVSPDLSLDEVGSDFANRCWGENWLGVWSVTVCLTVQSWKLGTCTFCRPWSWDEQEGSRVLWRRFRMGHTTWRAGAVAVVAVAVVRSWKMNSRKSGRWQRRNNLLGAWLVTGDFRKGFGTKVASCCWYHLLSGKRQRLWVSWLKTSPQDCCASDCQSFLAGFW